MQILNFISYSVICYTTKQDLAVVIQIYFFSLYVTFFFFLTAKHKLDTCSLQQLVHYSFKIVLSEKTLFSCCFYSVCYICYVRLLTFILKNFTPHEKSSLFVASVRFSREAFPFPSNHKIERETNRCNVP